MMPDGGRERVNVCVREREREKPRAYAAREMGGRGRERERERADDAGEGADGVAGLWGSARKNEKKSVRLLQAGA